MCMQTNKSWSYSQSADGLLGALTNIAGSNNDNNDNDNDRLTLPILVYCCLCLCPLSSLYAVAADDVSPP